MEEMVAVQEFFRIIAGGAQTDFPLEEEEKAFLFFRKQLKEWVHVTMRRFYKIERIVENENNC
jgi:hypothetical protein